MRWPGILGQLLTFPFIKGTWNGAHSEEVRLPPLALVKGERKKKVRCVLLNEAVSELYCLSGETWLTVNKSQSVKLKVIYGQMQNIILFTWFFFTYTFSINHSEVFASTSHFQKTNPNLQGFLLTTMGIYQNKQMVPIKPLFLNPL